jgi:thiol:disulfide interchange protein
LIAVVLGSSTAAAQFSLGNQSQEKSEQPLVASELLAQHAAVAPGSETLLAARLTIRPNWHVYYPITLGGIGLPTRVNLDLPDGLSVGRAQFPLPTYGEAAGLRYLGHADELVLLLPLRVGSDVTAGQTLKIPGTVDGLVCEDDGTCLPFENEVTLELSIAAEQGAPQHTALFQQSQENRLPELSAAPRLTGSTAFLSHEKLPKDTDATLYLRLDIEDRWHIQARNPGVEGLIPLRLFIERPDGINIVEDAQRWPTPKRVEQPGLGTVRQYAGEIAIATPIEITDPQLEIGPKSIRVLIEYQACNDAGVCEMPQMAEAFATFEVVPAGQLAVANAVADEAEKLLTAAGDTAAGGSTANLADVLWIFGLAFLGGLVLNIMPCVLPVISLKILGFLNQAGEARHRVFAMGLVYVSGILASFLVVALIMVQFNITWGAVMQEPLYIIALAGVVFAFGLSLLGVFEVQLPGLASNAAASAAGREGYAGAFLNGLMTTALATPCVGPFLAPALGLMLPLSPTLKFVGIMMIGLGLAFPYILLTAFPAWLKYVPKPGNWMVVFKQVTGFVMLAVVVWLLLVLSGQVEPEILVGSLLFLLCVGFGAWLIGQAKLNTPAPKSAGLWIGALSVILVGWAYGIWAFEDSGRIEWRDWQAGIAEQLAADGYTVYVDYTATWCLTCQANKELVLDTDAMADAFAQRNIVPIKADFTAMDPEMKSEIRSHGRDGVPLNVVYPAGRPSEPIILPELLSRQVVFEALEQAGASEQPISSLAAAPAATAPR